MVKVSIIVPVYNTAKYLSMCIESLINQTLKEIEIISKYLPKQLTDEELIQQVKDIIKSENAVSVKDMGKVMKVAKEQLGNTVNGKRLAECVKQQLNKEDK